MEHKKKKKVLGGPILHTFICESKKFAQKVCPESGTNIHFRSGLVHLLCECKGSAFILITQDF